MPIARAPRIEKATRFLNVDLEMLGDFDRAPLLAAFGSAVIVLHDGELRTRQPTRLLRLQLSREVGPPGERISELVALVRSLPPQARAVWNSALHRYFDIGVQAGLGPYLRGWGFGPELVKAVGEIGAGLTFSIYGADGQTEAEKSAMRAARKPRRRHGKKK